LPLTRSHKNQIIEQYVDLLQTSQGLFLADYRGLSVKELQQLRRQARNAGGRVRVVKNTLFRIALKRSGQPMPDEALVGPVLVGFATEEPSLVAKAFVEFAKNAPHFKIKGGILDGAVLSTEDVEAIAKLPPMEILRSQLIATIEAPMSNLLRLINAPMREIAQVLKARSEREEAQAA